jgi:hypothetical protein
MVSSDTLRQRVQALESELEQAGNALLTATAAYRATTTKAIATGDFTETEAAQAVRDAAAADHTRFQSTLTLAREMLAAAVAAERAAEKARAAEAIEVRLAELVTLATKADDLMIALIECLATARDLERSVQRDVIHGGFRSPWGGSEMPAAFYTAADQIKSQSSDWNPPDITRSAERIAAQATRRLQGALADG